MQYFEQTTYVGPAPISVETYVQIIAEQSAAANHASTPSACTTLSAAWSSTTSILDQVGPAVNSGRSIFLYGPPGNGKTSICERIVKSFGGSIFIPVRHRGQRARSSASSTSTTTSPSRPNADMRLQDKYDRRFRLIERPVIIVGGELTMETLDLIWNEESRFYEAPFQIKANGGAFMVDDFGRQRIDPKTLLNRWIVPLEKRVDLPHAAHRHEDRGAVRRAHRLLHQPQPARPGGRRLPAPHPLQDSDQRPDHENFRTIWRIISEAKGVPYADEIVDYFVEKHMRTHGRPLRGCLPRDILDNILDVCRYRQIEPTVTAEMLDDAAEAYFVKFDDKSY